MKTFTVIYKTGGTKRFHWHRMFESYRTYEDAQRKAFEITNMGYETLIHDTDLLNSIGVPDPQEDTEAKPKFSKQHYELIAARLRRAYLAYKLASHSERIAVNYVINCISDMLEEDNPHFDVEKFLQAIKSK